MVDYNMHILLVKRQLESSTASSSFIYSSSNPTSSKQSASPIKEEAFRSCLKSPNLSSWEYLIPFGEPKYDAWSEPSRRRQQSSQREKDVKPITEINLSLHAQRRISLPRASFTRQCKNTLRQTKWYWILHHFRESRSTVRDWQSIARWKKMRWENSCLLTEQAHERNMTVWPNYKASFHIIQIDIL